MKTCLLAIAFFVVDVALGADSNVGLIYEGASGDGLGNNAVSDVAGACDANHAVIAGTYSRGGKTKAMLQRVVIAGKDPRPLADTPLLFGSEDRVSQFRTLQRTSDCGFIAAGTSWTKDFESSVAIAARIGRDGTVIWQREYGDPAGENYFTHIVIEGATVLLVGGQYRYRGLPPDNYFSWFSRIDLDGNLNWESVEVGVKPKDLVRLPAGGFLASRYVIISGTYYSEIVRLDANGRVVATLDQLSRSEDFRIIRQTRDGNYIAGGNTLVKFDLNGNVLWRREDSTVTGYSAVIEDAAGNLVVAGTTRAGDEIGAPVVAKFDANGKSLWQYTFRTSPLISSHFHGILEYIPGSYLAVGAFNDRQERGNSYLALLRSTPNGF